MCGIVGTVQVGAEAALRTQVCSALRLMAHRGPDDEGIGEFKVNFRSGTRYAQDNSGTATVLMGHRRLSIIDLSRAARQPMSTEDGRFHLLLNGEIYNYRELQAELKEQGWHFRSASDTEVLLAGYALWGDDVLQRAVGMFAFALLDARRATLLLARDPFGIKPLYYTCAPGRLVFASEIKPLLEFPGVGRAVDPRLLHDFLLYGVSDHGHATLFADVQQLPAAHCMHISCEFPHRAHPAPYWTLERKDMPGSIADAAGEFRRLLEHSVRLHLRSDVPVGVSLSGGLDSSAIATMVRQVDADHCAMHAISYIADDPSLSEKYWCESAARAASLRQQEVHISPEEVASDFPQLVRAQEQPFASPTIYAQYRVYRAARDAGLKVMLSGQGADQYLGAYNPHLAVRLASLIRGGQWATAVTLACRTYGQPAGRYLRLRATAHHLLPAWLARQLRNLRDHSSPAVNQRWFMERGISVRSIVRLQHFYSLHELLRQTLFETQLPALLRIEDRNAMAFSIENRVPFLTRALVEFVFSRPEEDVIDNDGCCKSILLRAVHDLLPPDVLARRDKVGFAMPVQKLSRQLAQWMRGVLQDAPLVPALNAAEVTHQAELALSGNSASNGNQWPIWRWISLITWAQEFQVRFP